MSWWLWFLLGVAAGWIVVGVVLVAVCYSVTTDGARQR